jgi:EAL and modified HD-GYP domain-containing signal transduction protein
MNAEADQSAQDLAGYGIALQPLCNRGLEHIGDKLLYRDSAMAKQANVQDALLASARACASVMFDIGLHELVDDRFLLCTIPEEWFFNPQSILYPPDQVILEVVDSVWEHDQAPAGLARLQEAGFKVVVDAAQAESLKARLVNPPDIIKTDFRESQSPNPAFESAASRPLQMATFIETSEQLQQARQAGFDWLQGFVFSLPVVIPQTTHRRSGNRAVELQLLAQLSDDDCSLPELEPLLAQHPNLAVVVLRQANSAAFAPRSRSIETLGEAVMRIGSERLRTLISTFMLSSNEPIRALQARQLLVRAAMASNIAERIASISSRIAFSIGLFSRLDAFEGQSMEELVRDLPLSGDIRRALIHRDGELGKLLKVLDDFEAGQVDKFGQKTLSMLNEDYLRACAWADQWFRDDSGETKSQ